MKRSLIVIFFVLIAFFANSQIVFNKIIEDTVAHIPNSIICVDTGFVLSSGTLNEYGIRSFAFTYIDFEGEKQWKKVFGSDENEYWEGKDNNLETINTSYLLTGTYKDLYTDYRGIHFSVFDSTFSLKDQTILLYDTLWRKSFNTLVTSSNQVFFTGQTYDYTDNNYRLSLVKVDSNQNYVWDKLFGNRYEAGFQIIETSDKNILIGGLTFSFPTSITDEDWYLLKVDTAGNILWEKGFGNNSIYDGGVKGLIETKDSNYIACGSYPVLEVAGEIYKDGCLRKISKDGDLLWSKYLRSYSYYPPIGPTTINCSFSSVLEHKNGDILLVGNSYESYPRHRGFLTKLDSNCNIKWHRLYYAESESSNWQYLNVIKHTSDNGYIIAGYGNEYDEFGYDPPQQAWLVKTDSLGLDGLCYSEVPELNINIEFPEFICRNDTMEVYVNIAGKSAPYTIEFSTGQVIDSIFYPPLFVPIEIGLSQTSIEVGGIEYYSEQITEATLSNHEWGQCIAKPVEFYTPQFWGTHVIDITVTDAYGESKTITKSFYVIDCEDNIENENTCPIKLYPNPVKDKIYLEIPVTSTSLSHLENKVEIYNSVGQIVKTTNVHKGLNVVNVSELASGTYIVKITTEDRTFSLSFEKE